MPWRRTAALVVSIAALTGCNDDGRSLAPAPGVPDVPETVPTSVPVAGNDLQPTIAVEGLDDLGRLSATHTCDGADVAPDIVLTGIPEAAVEVAVVVRDLDADGFVHWVVAGLPPSTTRLASGVLPPSAVTADNGFGTPGWAGPCPPEDDGTHRYEFALHVLLEPIGLQEGLDGARAATLVENASVEVVRLEVGYERTTA